MANRVIDADGHICEPTAVWDEYVEKKHRADAIRVERDPDGRDWVSINGAIRRNLRPAAACVPWGMDDPNKVPTWDDILPGSYDGGARAKVLEEEGIERTLLYPSLYLIAGDIEDPAVAAAAAMATTNGSPTCAATDAASSQRSASCRCRAPRRPRKRSSTSPGSG